MTAVLPAYPCLRKTYKKIWTGESPAGRPFLRHGRKATGWRFYPAYLMAAPPAPRFPLFYTTPTKGLMITLIFQRSTGQAMQIIPMTKTGFRDYRAAAGHPAGNCGQSGSRSHSKENSKELGVTVTAYTLSIGDVEIDKKKFDREEIYNNFLAMPDKDAAKRAEELLYKRKEENDSTGGVIECMVEDLPGGVGEPVFEKLDAMLARAVFSIGAVKGFEIGSGFKAAKMKGSEHNDEYHYDENGRLIKLTNNAGGIVGGISDGYPIIFRAAFKPTPSIYAKQKSVNKEGENVEIQIEGRHDPIIVPRAVIVVEAMTAITLVDYLFQRILSRMDLIKKVFNN